VTDAPFWTPEYSLKRPEAAEAFKLVAALGGRRVRLAALAALFATGVFLTVSYGLNPSHLELPLLGLLTVGVYLAVALAPSWRAWRGAAQVAKLNGRYRLGFSPDGRLLTPDGESSPLRGDKRARAFETDELFVIRPDRLRTFCLPKRVLTAEQCGEVRRLLSDNLARFEKSPGQTAREGQAAGDAGPSRRREQN
jgi:hypothetical protein